MTIPDIRWARCDIKSVSLLPNVLGKQQAAQQGAFEAWMIDRDGNVTEGTSTNSWIVTADKRVITRQLSAAILAGITRASLFKLIAADNYKLEERPFTLAEAKAAAEAFLTSSTSLVLPVTQIDDTRIGDGKPGPMTRKLREAMLAHVSK
jgi:D-alanine transaminase